VASSSGQAGTAQIQHQPPRRRKTSAGCEALSTAQKASEGLPKKWHQSLDKEITLSLQIVKGATLLEVNQTVQAFQEQIYMDCQKQALTWTMSKLKAACSAESITNEILHIEYEEPFVTETYKEARKKATLELGEKEMMYTRWKVREVLQSKLLSNEQKEDEELDFRRQIYDLKDPKKAMEWLYEKVEGELPQAVEHATKKN